MAKVTDHGVKRIKERCGLKKKSVVRAARNALSKGVTHKNARGQLKRHLSDLYTRHETANNMRVYAEKVWVFRNDVLITVLHLPNHLKKYV